ncbi:MAG: ISAs1 family transposase, partial [Pseudonocardia sp.]
MRHPLVAVLTAAVCAVAAGARSFVATAEWVADLPAEVAAVLGVDARCPSESTIRRLIGHVDADRFDAAIGAFVQGLCARVAPAGRRRVLAVDGKTVRGSRHTDSHEVTTPGRHLLAVIDQHARVVLGQVKVEGKTNEITAFAPLLDRVDIGGALVTADALHTQHRHADYLTARGAYYLLTVKRNQPSLHRQLTALPWAAIPATDLTRGKSHGRVESRTVKLTAVTAGIGFPGARLAAQITRRRRTRTGRTWRTETVYAVTN